MFTESCYIRIESDEMRESVEQALINIGYQSRSRGSICNFIHVANGLFWNYRFEDSIPHAYKCGTNEKLFLSLCALNDENDFMQWFRIDRENANNDFIEAWRQCKEERFDINTVPYYGCYNYEKATKDMLIKHFGDEK